MADIKWIKITTDIFDDEKILLIESMPDADALIVIWFKLLCLAGKQNNSGVFTLNDKIPYTDEMLATIFRRPTNTVRLALQTFEAYGMIDVIDGVITIPNWEKHQNIDALERIKEQSRISSAKYREKQRLLQSDVKVTSRDQTDKNREDKNREDIEDKRKRFVPPSVEEVKAYIDEKGYSINPDSFVDYYTSNGWHVGKNKMKDWKACVRSWNNREKKPTKPSSQIGRAESYDDDTMKKMLLSSL